MTLSLNISTSAKTGLVVAGAAPLLVLWSWLAGGIVFVGSGRDFDSVTPATMLQLLSAYDMLSDKMSGWIWIGGTLSAALILTPLWFLFSPAKKSLFGDADFASRKDVEKAGLLGEKGIIVGRLYNRYLMFKGAQHALISAPTRSGKGVGIVLPNLLNWPDSLVVLDIKQENWDITSGYRRKYGQDCYLFNPAAVDFRTHRYNPLSYISDNPVFRIDDIQKIGNMLFPDQPGTDVIWTATPRSLFLGIVLFLLETPGKQVTLGQVLRETLGDGDGKGYFTKIIEERDASKKPLSRACKLALSAYTSIASDNTRSGIITGFRSKLELWFNPLVDAATSDNDFDLRDVRKRRMSIYLGVTPDNLERMAPLLNLFFQQLIDLNTRELPNQNSAIKYTCLLLMDEFTAIGKIQILSKGISYIAGYWLRMLPIIQSPAQLVEVYGKDAAQTFQTNHALQIIYPPKASETQTAKDISEWLGYQTVKGVSESRGKGFFGKKTPTESHSDQRRALLLPQEITGLGQGKELIIVENCPPILANKCIYYSDPVFIDRLKEASAAWSNQMKKAPILAAIKRLPKQHQLDAAIQSGELGAPVPLIDLNDYMATATDSDPTVNDVASTVAPQKPTEKTKAEDMSNPAFRGFIEFSAWDIGKVDTDKATAFLEEQSRKYELLTGETHER